MSPSSTVVNPRPYALIIWLIGCAAMVVAMMLIGAITRLTESGLSMVEYRPLIGVFPPLSDAEWSRVFGLYRTTSEYRLENSGMSLADFKAIFWWEYVHRLWGRLIGAAFGIPLLWFVLRRTVPSWLKPHLFLLLLLGGTQGIIGWWMVKSGFIDRHDVSQYRLTVHLSVAFIILGYMIWLIADLLEEPGGDTPAPGWLRNILAVMLAIVFVTLTSGGLVAGLNAGFVYNTWPSIAGSLLPDGLFDTAPPWRAAFEDTLTVQFDHRILAYLTLAGVIIVFIAGRSVPGTPFQKRILTLLAVAAILQVMLGIATLLSVVAISFAVLHQFGAIFLFCCAVIAYRAHR